MRKTTSPANALPGPAVSPAEDPWDRPLKILKSKAGFPSRVKPPSVSLFSRGREGILALVAGSSVPPYVPSLAPAMLEG